MTRANQLVAWAEGRLGCPYIFGAAGQTCTPAYRRGVMASKPAYADAIRGNCPVLRGSQSTCAGCKYNGKPSYDCRGLTREGIRAVTGRPVMGAGATSQWNDESNWEVKGPISEMPAGKVCLVFVQKGSTMSHTGIYTGSSAIHASGHKSGVIDSPMPRSWTHYAIPIGLYNGSDGEEGRNQMELKFGSRGEAVRQLQENLMALGYDVGKNTKADGIFGAATEAGVMAFQRGYGLPVTGVWTDADQGMMDSNLLPPEEPVDDDAPPVDKTGLLTELEGLNKRQAVIIAALKGVM